MRTRKKVRSAVCFFFWTLIFIVEHAKSQNSLLEVQAQIKGAKYANAYATCNGSSNDTTGIQAGLNDAAGSTFIFPSGYTCNNNGTSWTVPANTTVVFQDATSKGVLTGGGADTKLFTAVGANVRFINPQLSDSRSFVFGNSSYGIFASGQKNTTIHGGNFSGFSYAAIGGNGFTGLVIDGWVNCHDIGSMNDGFGHFEGRCIDLGATTTTSTNVHINGVKCTNVGKHCISSETFGSAYALNKFTIADVVCDFIGDTCVTPQDAEHGSIANLQSSRDGQNGIDHLGQGFNVSGHTGTPAFDIQIGPAQANDGGENGGQVGFNAKQIHLHGLKFHNRGSCGLKLADNFSEIDVNGVEAIGSTMDGVCLRPTVISGPSGTTTAGSCAFTDSNGNFPTTITTGGYDGHGMDILIVGAGSPDSRAVNAVYISTVTARASRTIITLASPCPSQSLSGNARYFYGQFGRLVNLSGLTLNGNRENGLNIQESLHVNVIGGTYCNNNQSLTGRAGIIIQQSQDVSVRGGVQACDNQPAPTQAYGIRAFNSDTVHVEQPFGSGNVISLFANLTDGASSNVTSETDTGGLVPAVSAALITPTIGGGNKISSSGAGGTMATKLTGTVSASTTPIAARRCGGIVTATIKGAAVGNRVIVTPPTAGLTSGLIIDTGHTIVTTANTIQTGYCNVSGNPITPRPATLNITVVQ